MKLHLVLMGPPQAGKGTQARHMATRFGLVHLATGDLLREISQEETPRGRLVGDLLRRGEYVPDDLVTQLVVERMDANDVLLDGYPRTVTQAETLERLRIPVQRVFVLAVPEQVLIDRAQDRLFCPDCNAVYGIRTNPPLEPWICDVCEHGLAQRLDDAPATVHRRLEIYRQRSESVVRFYEARGVVVRVDGSGSVIEVANTLETLTTQIFERRDAPTRRVMKPTVPHAG